jgi:uncharacterized protein (TIGR02271 family)
MQRTIHEGMRVRTADDELLGTVVRCGDDGFVVEKGHLLPQDIILLYEEVADVRGDEVRLVRTRGALLPGLPSGQGEKPRERRLPLAPLGDPQEHVLELAQEELVPETVVREVGQLRITKVVRTEMKEIRVPVRREELRIERVAVEEGAAPGEGAGPLPRVFEEGTLVIPLYEEHVEVSKRPRVWQEVRVHKDVVEELRPVHGAVRREVARVEEQGEVLREGPPEGLHA